MTITKPPRPEGMLPGAFNSFLAASKVALPNFLPENVVQTVGTAPKSAGFHLPDGTFKNEHGQMEEWCAATDLSVLHPIHLSGSEVSDLLLALLHNGFCPFWRHEGLFMNGPHIHMVWSSTPTPMKPELRAQVHDFCNGRNGLVGHSPDTFWTHFIHQAAWEISIQNIRTNFFKANPVND